MAVGLLQPSQMVGLPSRLPLGRDRRQVQGRWSYSLKHHLPLGVAPSPFIAARFSGCSGRNACFPTLQLGAVA